MAEEGVIHHAFPFGVHLYTMKGSLKDGVFVDELSGIQFSTKIGGWFDNCWVLAEIVMDPTPQILRFVKYAYLKEIGGDE